MNNESAINALEFALTQAKEGRLVDVFIVGLLETVPGTIDSFDFSGVGGDHCQRMTGVIESTAFDRQLNAAKNNGVI